MLTTKIINKYFMCTSCYNIHKLELVISVKTYGKSKAFYNTNLSISNYLRCNHKKKITKAQEKLIIKEYYKMKDKGIKIHNPIEEGCRGSLVQIDKKMIYAVQTLNIKGYETQFCCQGHANNDRANLILKPYYYHMLETICPPVGWRYKYDDKIYKPNNRVILVYNIEDINDNTYIYNLNKWVDSLPSLR